MVIYVDIDNTLCYSGEDRPYEKAVPKWKAIEKVNKFYDDGHEIIIWTARGTGNGLSQYIIDLTSSQLDRWGVKYHELKFEKPLFDMFFDDKAFNASELLK
jgi:hypothetical protein